MICVKETTIVVRLIHLCDLCITKLKFKPDSSEELPGLTIWRNSKICYIQLTKNIVFLSDAVWIQVNIG